MNATTTYTMTEVVSSPMRAGTCKCSSSVRVTIILRAGAPGSQRGGEICPNEGALLTDIPTRGVDRDSDVYTSGVLP